MANDKQNMSTEASAAGHIEEYIEEADKGSRSGKAGDAGNSANRVSTEKVEPLLPRKLNFRPNTYAWYAENDFQFFRWCWESGMKGNPMSELAHSVCQRYLQHMVLYYSKPDTIDACDIKDRILYTESLSEIIKYIEDGIVGMGIEVPEDLTQKLLTIRNFHLTRFPGAFSFLASADDIDRAYEAVSATREFVWQFCREQEES